MRLPHGRIGRRRIENSKGPVLQRGARAFLFFRYFVMATGTNHDLTPWLISINFCFRAIKNIGLQRPDPKSSGTVNRSWSVWK